MTPNKRDLTPGTYDQQVLEETVTDASGNLVKKIVYSIGLDHISQTTFTPSGPAQGTTAVFHMDGHGSTRVLTEFAGSILMLTGQTQVFHFDAYGNALNFNMSTAATQYLYSGEQFDARIGQQYLRARYYDQSTGTFNRLDPFFGNTSDPQSFHKYRYTSGDPIRFADPSGNFEGLSGLIAGTGMVSALASVPGIGDIVRVVYQGLLEAYAANLEWDLEWAENWDLPDNLNSHSDETWVQRAILGSVVDEYLSWFDSLLPDSPNGSPTAAGALNSPSSRIGSVRIGFGRALASGRKLIKDALGKGHSVAFFTHPSLKRPVLKFSRNTVKQEVKITPTRPLNNSKEAVNAARKADIRNANIAAGKPADFRSQDWSNENGYGQAYTWHHDTRRGIMQLVPSKVHGKGHVGGMELWWIETN